MLERYIGVIMVLIHNINNNIEEPTQRVLSENERIFP